MKDKGKSRLATIFNAVRSEYEKNDAPIAELIRVRTSNTFRVLVATILSARTKDETTAGAADRLFRLAKSPAALRKLSRKRIERAIFPVGFYRTKAKHLKQMPDVLDKSFGGRIPGTIEELCRLPGVGRKTANLVLAEAFGKPAICVDVHVHRISNRLGLVQTRTPFETEMALRRILPVSYWRGWNTYLVGYGQTICTPRNPKCGACRLRRLCPRVGSE